MINKNIYNNSEDEIDLLILFKTIWEGKKKVIRFIVIFGVIGLFIAVFSEKEYTASTTVIPQISGSKVGGGLGGLAAMAGINLGRGNNESIPPSLYPQIVESVPFKKELLKVPLNFSYLKKEVTYKEYYGEYRKINVLAIMKEYTIGLPGKIISLFKNKSINVDKVVEGAIYKVSKEENMLFKQLGKQLVIENNNEDGFIEISCSMPEALPASQMTKKIQELLQKSITDFKIRKTKDEFEFIEERYNELKIDFEKKQVALASFRDRNKGLITSRSQSRIEKLQSEYNLAYSIYSELAKQLETQKIKLKENTPVFTIIKPVSVPVDKSKPKRVLIIIVWLFLGVISGIGVVFGEKMLKKLKKDMK